VKTAGKKLKRELVAAGRFLAEQGTTEFEQHPHNICQGL
jgi:hypothetical protein